MHAHFHLSTQLRGKHSTLDRSFISPPFKLLTLPAQDDGILRAVQLSASPGLLGGDSLTMEIQLAEHTALALYTQSFTRILSMHPNQHASQHSRINQAANTRFYYLPQPLVLHRDSQLFQRTEIHLNDNCELLYGEIIAAGRILYDEAFAFSRLSSQLHIFYQDQPLIYDNIQWQPQKHALNALGQMEDYTHQLNLFYLHTAHSSAQMQAHIEKLYAAISAQATTSLWGITQAHAQGLCLRAISRNAQALQDLQRLATATLNLPLHRAFV